MVVFTLKIYSSRFCWLSVCIVYFCYYSSSSLPNEDCVELQSKQNLTMGMQSFDTYKQERKNMELVTHMNPLNGVGQKELNKEAHSTTQNNQSCLLERNDIHRHL